MCLCCKCRFHSKCDEYKNKKFSFYYLTYRISWEIFGIFITGFIVSSVSVVDFDFLTGVELDREFLVPIIFFFSSDITGGFLIVDIIFFDFFILLLFKMISLSDVSDSDVLADGLIIIVFRRELFDWFFVDDKLCFESIDNLLRA